MKIILQIKLKQLMDIVLPKDKKSKSTKIYSAFPIKEVRSDVMNSKYKTDLKAWLRKYLILLVCEVS
jgi:hypothetical protein